MFLMAGKRMNDLTLKLFTKVFLSLVISAGYYAASIFLDGPSSEFFSIVLLSSLLFLVVFSPERSIKLGLKAVKIYDWVAALGIAVFLGLIMSSGSFGTVLFVSIVYFVFFVSFMVRARRE